MATVISHRGYWLDPAERNSREAFERSFSCGYGVETDVRDHAGRLVISHDPPGGDEPTLDDLLASYVRYGCPGTLALNVKADGLQKMLSASMAKHGVGNWFVFDMSVPDCISYARDGMPFFTRLSEFEPTAVQYEQSAGVWVDAFEGQWFDDSLLSHHLDAGKQVCVVSPELHGRDPVPTWDDWAAWPAFAAPQLIVCTDHPTTLHQRLRP